MTRNLALYIYTMEFTLKNSQWNRGRCCNGDIQVLHLHRTVGTATGRLAADPQHMNTLHLVTKRSDLFNAISDLRVLWK
jgi:hypothetical protein